MDERDTAAYRDQVFSWLKQLAERGLGKLAYPDDLSQVDLGAFIAAFETLAFFDLSLVVKVGVNFGLFGGSIYFLGTERHHREVLPKVASLELPGCFAMSELGHGSNVRDVETVARYDARARASSWCTRRRKLARKEWIGNAALHARMATVFAQLEVNGERHGVHALLVPLRDEHGQLLPGRPRGGLRAEDGAQRGGQRAAVVRPGAGAPGEPAGSLRAGERRRASTPAPSPAPRSASSPCWARWWRAG